jgi:hypothetical protein
MLDLLGAQFDAVVVEALPVDIEFDVAIRLVGPEQDFQTEHLVEVVLSALDLEELGRLPIPVAPRRPGRNRIPGYEINHMLAARIDLPADTAGGYDLSFAIDRQAQHHQKTTISVVMRP